jgi:hypothetical protein
MEGMGDYLAEFAEAFQKADLSKVLKSRDCPPPSSTLNFLPHRSEQDRFS